MTGGQEKTHPKRATRRRRTSSAFRLAGGMGWSSAGGGAGRLGGAPAVPRPSVKRFRAAGALKVLMSACRSGSWSQHCPVPLTVRGTQALVSFAPLAFKLFYAARQNAVLRRSPFPPP